MNKFTAIAIAKQLARRLSNDQLVEFARLLNWLSFEHGDPHDIAAAVEKVQLEYLREQCRIWQANTINW